VEPITHFLTGACLSRAGLNRKTPLATLTLVVNGLSLPVFQLVTSGTPKTSAYPGTCTNFSAPKAGDGSSADTNTDGTPKPDFDLTGNTLTPLDCGGTAVISVTGTLTGGGTATLTFVWPPDSDNDGMPDAWEKLYCPATNPNCLVKDADIEQLGSNPAVGDAFANFDEWRGFIVSGTHIRTDPTKKDLFVHLLNPQCSRTYSTTPAGGATDSLIGKSSPTDTRTIYPVDGTSILADLPNLGGSSTTVAIHFLGFNAGGTNTSTNEWMDNLARYLESLQAK